MVIILFFKCIDKSNWSPYIISLSQNHSIIPHQEPSQEPPASSASSPTQKQTLTIHPKELNESGKDNPTWVGGGSPAL